MTRGRSEIKTLVVITVATLFCRSAFAQTDCAYPAVNALFNGDLGGGTSAVWIAAGNKSSWILKSNPDSTQIFAVALAKKMAGGPITIRYSATGVDCNAGEGRGDMVGIWAN